jgi:hypothetical protein
MTANTVKLNASRSWKYRVVGRGSAAVATLEAAWNMLRELERRIPLAVLTFVDARSRDRVHGYCARSTWKKRTGAAHEVAISPGLIGHPEDLLETMLHEAAHAVLFEAGANGGMGSTRYYHTKTFRDQCRAFGLACDFLNSRYGWTLTAWPVTGVADRYKPVLARLRRGLPSGTGGRAPGRVKPGPLPPAGHTVLVCGCPDGDRTVYVKKSVLDAGGIMCSFCKREFRRTADVHHRKT